MQSMFALDTGPTRLDDLERKVLARRRRAATFRGRLSARLAHVRAGVATRLAVLPADTGWASIPAMRDYPGARR